MTSRLLHIAPLLLTLQAALHLHLGVLATYDILDLCLDQVNCKVRMNVSDPENCSGYFVCMGSSLYPRSCNPGETFHQNILQCLTTHQSCQESCTNGSYKQHIVYATTTPVPVAVMSTEMTSSIASQRSPTTLAPVVSTSSAVAMETTTSTAVTGSDVTRSSSVTTSSVTRASVSQSVSAVSEPRRTTSNWQTTAATVAMTSCPPPYPCVIGATLADPDDCARYYRCVSSDNDADDRRWMLHNCLSGSRFDYVQSACRPATETVSCHPKCPEGLLHNLTMLPTSPRDGATLQFNCTFRYVFAQVQIQLRRFVWFLNDMKLSRVTSGRLKINVSQPDLTGTWHSTLTFDPATAKDSGMVRCAVEYGSGDYSYVDSEPFHVLSAPRVSVDPIAVGAYIGQTLDIKCSDSDSTSQTNISWSWLRDGQQLPQHDRVETVQRDYVNISVLTTTVVDDVVYSCRAVNKAGTSRAHTCTVTAIKRSTPVCKADTAEGAEWTLTAVNSVAISACPRAFSGTATRRCVPSKEDKKSAHWLTPDLSQCTDERVLQLAHRVSTLSQGVGVDNASTLAALATTLRDSLLASNMSARLTQATWYSAFNVMHVMAAIRRRHPDTPVHRDELQAMLAVTSRLVQDSRFLPFPIDNMTAGESAASLMRMIDSYSLTRARQLTPGEPVQTIVDQGIVVQLYAEKARQIDSLSFPHHNRSSQSVDWLHPLQDNIFLSGDALRPRDDTDDICYVVSTYYETLGQYLPTSGADEVASRVLSLTVDNCINSSQQLQPPVHITLQRDQQNTENMLEHCAYWDYNAPPKGEWSTEGCEVVSVNSSTVSCSCNHLTNFAILFSLSPAVGQHAVILSIISVVGCIISVVALLLTVIFYAVKWKQLKSHHAMVLINLCVALIIANVVFLAGANQVNNQVWCKVVAVLLHYFFLAAFFLMLVQGVEMILYIVFPFHTRRRRETAALIFAAWFIPAAIVGLSLGITRTEGYAGHIACWLSIETGLIWAFVVPALIIICLNFIILIVVLYRVSRIKGRIDKRKTKERVRATMWNILVIMPVLGVMWVFGVLSVNEDLIAFQYVFAIANSLQGFFIFVFNALCNKKASQKKAKYSVKPVRHGRDGGSQHQTGATARPRDSRTDHTAAPDDVMMIIAGDSSSRDHEEDMSALTGQSDAAAGRSSDVSSSSSSTGSSQAAESDYPSERTSTTELSSTSTFSPLRPRPTNIVIRPASAPNQRPLERIISGSSC